MVDMRQKIGVPLLPGWYRCGRCWKVAVVNCTWKSKWMKWERRLGQPGVQVTLSMRARNAWCNVAVVAVEVWGDNNRGVDRIDSGVGLRRSVPVGGGGGCGVVVAGEEDVPVF